MQWVYDDAAGTLTPNILTDTAGIRQVIENVIVEPVGGLTRVYNSGLHTLTLGLDLEDLIQVGANMVKSYNGRRAFSRLMRSAAAAPRGSRLLRHGLSRLMRYRWAAA